jgi:LysM repeat protein
MGSTPETQSFLATSSTTYTIRSGDTFSSVAKSHGLDLNAVLAANHGVNPESLHVGQVIHLPPHGGSTHPGSSTGGSHPSSGGVPGSTGGGNGGGGYVNYSGPASKFPSPSEWASYSALWAKNAQLMKYHDSEEEIGHIKSAIEQVARESGIDVRVILTIVSVHAWQGGGMS